MISLLTSDSKKKTRRSINRLLLLLSIIFTILVSLFTLNPVSAWTFEGRDWWFSTGASFEVANIAITYTYPDRLRAGEQLDIIVMLEYVDNQMANANFAIFSDVQAHLRDLSERKKIGTTNGNNYIDIKEYEPLSIKSSGEANSGVIKKGEQYLTSLSLPTYDLNGNYSVDLSFRSFFSLGNSISVYPWDSMYYLGEGNLVENDLPPINIVQKNHDNARDLAIAIMKPHGLTKPVTISVNGTAYDTIEGRVKVSNLTADANYEVEVPAQIDLIQNEVKGVFNKWSDGNSSAKRNIVLDKNKELFAIYDTQYWLNVTSSLNDAILLDGWVKSGEPVELSVDQIRSMIGALTLQGFAGWIGDVYETDTSISFSMDGPKDVVEDWKFDGQIIVTLLLIFGTVIGGVIAVIENRKHIATFFSRLRERTR
jgi:hypothetical protein